MQAFSTVLSNTENPMAASVLLLLAWVACVDGKVDPAEMMSLQQTAGRDFSCNTLDAIVSIASESRVCDLQLACEFVQQLVYEKRQAVLKMAIEMALKDGVLSAAESHIIRLVADIASVPPRVLDDFFLALTGDTFPPASDLSDPQWWVRAESKKYNDKQNNDRQKSAGGRPDSFRRMRDLALLGLEEDADRNEIVAAYRRIVQIHHPDKYQSLGNDAAKSAEATFKRIQAAYERLLAQ